RPNRHFALPAPDRDIIMVGPGTGVAPFRAFVQERRAAAANGRNWLFFGDRHFTHDFLYQLEWQEALKDGALTRMDVAFSRDQPEKIYVQDRLWACRRDVIDWIEGGGYFYVCGDAKAMAKDVRAALVRAYADVKSIAPSSARCCPTICLHLNRRSLRLDRRGGRSRASHPVRRKWACAGRRSRYAAALRLAPNRRGPRWRFPHHRQSEPDCRQRAAATPGRDRAHCRKQRVVGAAVGLAPQFHGVRGVTDLRARLGGE